MNMNTTTVQRLIKAGSALLIVLSLYVLVLFINAIKENKYIGSVPSANVISVSGQGEVFAVPDTAEFTYSVREQADTVSEAQRLATDKTNAVLTYLEEQGIEDKDIKTINYNVSPRYEWHQTRVECLTYPCPQPPGEQTLVGYEVTQTVRVKVRESEDAGTLLAGVGDLGVDNVSSLSFTVDDDEALKRDARAMAITNARQKAEQLADDLDVDLVRVVSFFENEGGYPEPVYARVAYDAAEGFGGDSATVAPKLPAGENSITSQVTVTYEIR